MNIIVLEQAVLDLILAYWNNLSSTFKHCKNRNFGTLAMEVISGNSFFEFTLSKESYEIISIKYFHKELSNNYGVAYFTCS